MAAGVARTEAASAWRAISDGERREIYQLAVIDWTWQHTHCNGIIPTTQSPQCPISNRLFVGRGLAARLAAFLLFVRLVFRRVLPCRAFLVKNPASAIQTNIFLGRVSRRLEILFGGWSMARHRHSARTPRQVPLRACFRPPIILIHPISAGIFRHRCVGDQADCRRLHSAFPYFASALAAHISRVRGATMNVTSGFAARLSLRWLGALGGTFLATVTRSSLSVL